MKKYIALLLSILIIFTFVACTNDTNDANNQNTFVEIYKNKANEFVKNGDVDSAIKVLEEGISKTNDEELQKMLDELQNDVGNNVSNENTNLNEYSKYEGDWRVRNTDEYFHTDLTLKIDINNTKMNIVLRYEYLPSNYDYTQLSNTVAQIVKEVDISEIKDNTLVLNYDNDGCGNSGKVKLSFSNTFILCESDYFTQDYYFWGFCFSMCKFEKR